jgi:chemotaxis-related protein WspD
MSSSSSDVRHPADCWNDIGVRGDRSCPELTHHCHCRNCPVYAQAARGLLDRPALANDLPEWKESEATSTSRADDRSGTRSVTVFRAGNESFAIATSRCVEAVNSRKIHRLPHRGHCVLGLANIHGELILCLSFAGLLNLDRSARPVTAETGKLLVTEWREGPVALAVDEMKGARRFAVERFKPLPATLLHRHSRCSGSLLDLDGACVAVLDDEPLEQTIKRQLT